MKVLVTGHLGYIGGHLLPQLKQAGHEVVGCDAGFFAECLFSPSKVTVPNLNLDVRDIQKQHLFDFDAVIHLAGLSNDPLGNFNPNLTYSINQHASVDLANAAKQAGVQRFLFASSCSNYGAGDEGWLTEDSVFNPQTPYGASKVAAETAIAKLSDADFTSVNLRAGTVYGVAPTIRFDLVVNNLVAYAVHSGEVLLKSDGQAWRPLVHVSDVAAAYVACLHAPRNMVAGEAFNVGATQENYKIIDVARRIEALVPDCQVVLQPQAQTDTRNYRVNCDKLGRRLPNFAPKWQLDQGILELLQAFTQHPVSPNDFEGPRYNRLAHLRSLIKQRKLNEHLRWSQAQKSENALQENAL